MASPGTLQCRHKLDSYKKLKSNNIVKLKADRCIIAKETEMDDCIFCKISQGVIPANKLYEDDEVVAFWDLNPQAPKHFLIIPKKHVVGPATLAPADEALMGRLTRRAAELATRHGIPDFRLVMNNGAKAGQSVFHLHMHVLGGRPLSWPPG